MTRKKATRSQKVEAVKSVMTSIYSSQKTLRTLAPDFKWAGLGNLLGDYGEFIAINHYNLIQAPRGSAGFDATTKGGKTVQVKTNHAANMIGYRGKADKMLVLHVESNGEWEELYYGDFKKVKNASNFSKRDNKFTIPILKLKKLAKH